MRLAGRSVSYLCGLVGGANKFVLIRLHGAKNHACIVYSRDVKNACTKQKTMPAYSREARNACQCMKQKTMPAHSVVGLEVLTEGGIKQQLTARRKAERAQMGWGGGEWQDGVGEQPLGTTLIAG